MDPWKYLPPGGIQSDVDCFRPCAQFVPRFCKKYAAVGEEIRAGLDAFRADVEQGLFPTQEYSPYLVSEDAEAPAKCFRPPAIASLSFDVFVPDACVRACLCLALT